jgi:hypothetical protein
MVLKRSAYSVTSPRIAHPFAVVTEIYDEATRQHTNHKLSFLWHFKTYFQSFDLNIFFQRHEIIDAGKRNT